MSGRRKLQIGTDLTMTALLPVLMAYSLVGELAHEWLGIGMFGLFVLHHVLNRWWIKSLGKGPYSAERVLGTAVDLLLLLVMIALPVSGVVMSKHLFTWLPVSGGAYWARIVHMLAGYWGFVFMNVHLGLHWSMVCRASGFKGIRRVPRWLPHGVSLLVCAYGAFAFTKRQLGTYLLLRSEFVFFDFSEPLPYFLLDYIAIMILFAAIGYYLRILILSLRK